VGPVVKPFGTTVKEVRKKVERWEKYGCACIEATCPVWLGRGGYCTTMA